MDVKSLSPACVTPAGNTYTSLCTRRPLLRNQYLNGRRLTKCSSLVLGTEQRRRSLAVSCSSSQKLEVSFDEASSSWVVYPKSCVSAYGRESQIVEPCSYDSCTGRF